MFRVFRAVQPLPEHFFIGEAGSADDGTFQRRLGSEEKVAHQLFRHVFAVSDSKP